MNPKLKNCNIYAENIDQLTPEEFTLLRRNTLGASDASVILGLQSQWKTVSDLLDEKIAPPRLTQAEIEVSEKPNVRKGRDLEPLILQKAQDILGSEIIKPSCMYTLKEHPHLSINFDGLTLPWENKYIPVEAKFVTTFGDKFYNKEKAIVSLHDVTKNIGFPENLKTIQEKANHCGIPDYYFAQVQQQLLATGTNHAFLAALHDKDWTLRFYLVPKDTETQDTILLETYKFWQKVLKYKERNPQP